MENHSTNYILHAKSREFYWEGHGQLSIKTFSCGKAQYKSGKGFFAVEESRYLLLNEGPYTISIDEDNEVDSFCIFFKNGFAGEVLRTHTDSSDRLLTDPFKPVDALGFFEKTYDTSSLLDIQLNSLKMNLDFFKANPIGYEEQFYLLMKTLLFNHVKTLKETESLSSLRHSTREELYRRVSIAHDYIRSFYHQTIQLNEIAQIACLSPNHLIRAYTQAYGRTPHQHITEFRVQKAKDLLGNSDLNMTEITFEIGLNNPVSFSKLFRQYVGISPLQFRKKVILDKN